MKTLKNLVNAGGYFENENTDETENTLLEFLTQAALESGESNNDFEAVQLMTVHSAKGLEFNSVFVSGLEEGLFPHENSISVNTTRRRKKINVCGCYQSKT